MQLPRVSKMKAKVVTTATEQGKSSGAKPQEASQGRRLVTKAAAAAAVATDEAPASRGAQQFLIKSEPHEYSIDDLASKPGGIGQWDGIRNFRARNLLKTIQVGEQMFFYHSSCKVPAVVGIAELVREAYPDFQSWDPSHKYYDPKSSPESPRWFMMDIKLVRKLRREIPLSELKAHAGGALEGMVLFSVPRLSVQPVSREHWDFILSLEDSLPTTAPAAAGAKGAAKGTGKAAARGDEPLAATKGAARPRKRAPGKPSTAADAAAAAPDAAGAAAVAAASKLDESQVKPQRKRAKKGGS